MLGKVAVALSAVALALVMLVGVVDIVAGEFFGYYLAFKVDMSGTMTAAAIFLTWPLVQQHKEHIAIDLFTTWHPRWFARVQPFLIAATGVVFFGLLAYGAISLARESFAIMERSAATLGYPIWPAKIACALGAVAALLIASWQVLSELFARKPDIASGDTQ